MSQEPTSIVSRSKKAEMMHLEDINITKFGSTARDNSDLGGVTGIISPKRWVLASDKTKLA